MLGNVCGGLTVLKHATKPDRWLLTWMIVVTMVTKTARGFPTPKRKVPVVALRLVELFKIKFIDNPAVRFRVALWVVQRTDLVILIGAPLGCEGIWKYVGWRKLLQSLGSVTLAECWTRSACLPVYFSDPYKAAILFSWKLRRDLCVLLQDAGVESGNKCCQRTTARAVRSRIVFLVSWPCSRHVITHLIDEVCLEMALVNETDLTWRENDTCHL